MTPIQVRDGVTIYNADCLDVLPMLEAGSVDAVICDPPYGTTACAWDSVIPFGPMWAGIKHVVKPSAAVVLFGSQPFTSALVMSNPQWFKYEWIWDKVLSGSGLNADYQPLKTHENICVFSQMASTYSPAGNMNYIPQMEQGEPYWRSTSRTETVKQIFRTPIKQFPRGSTDGRRYPKSIAKFSNAHRTGRPHQTEKPVALLEYLIRTYTNPGETVVDFAMGSGSTGEACMNTGRRFIGIEKDVEIFNVAHERLAGVEPTLFIYQPAPVVDEVQPEQLPLAV